MEEGAEPVESLTNYARGRPVFKFQGNRSHVMDLLAAHVPQGGSQYTSPDINMAQHSCVDDPRESQGVKDSHQSENVCSNCGSSLTATESCEDSKSQVHCFHCTSSFTVISSENSQAIKRRKHLFETVGDSYLDNQSCVCTVQHNSSTDKHSESQMRPPEKVKHYVLFVGGYHDRIHVFSLSEDDLKALESGEELSNPDTENVRSPTHVLLFQDCYVTGITLSRDHR